MRILKFLGVFLATLLIVFLVVFGYNLNALFTLFDNQKGIKEGQEWVEKTRSLKGLTEYIGAQPERVSIASYAINNPDSSIQYNVHQPRTMGRLANIFLVIEYARQVEQGKLNPEESIPFDLINQYQLPFMDASNHEDALQTLRESQEEADTQAAPLRDVVEASVAFNDIAIADYLLYKLGINNVEQLLSNLQIEETESPLPFSGMYITINPHLQDRSTETHFDSLGQLSRNRFSQLAYRNTEKFIADNQFRDNVLRLFEEREGLDIKFTSQRDALAFFPKTTAREMAGLMKSIQRGELISPAVDKRVQSILAWPLRTNDRLNDDFSKYGAIYDNRMGMVNGIDFGASSYTGEPFAQAVFFDELQIAFWFHMSSNLMHQDFEQRLIWDPALRQATIKAIENPQSDTSATS